MVSSLIGVIRVVGKISNHHGYTPMWNVQFVAIALDGPVLNQKTNLFSNFSSKKKKKKKKKNMWEMGTH